MSRIPGELASTRLELLSEVDAMRGDLTGQVAAARKDADAQITALRGDLKSEATALLTTSDFRLSSIQGSATAAIDRLTNSADRAVNVADSLRTDIKPMLDNTAMLTKDAKDSWDDLYWDLKADVETSDVLMRNIAETSDAVRKAAPEAAAAAVGIEKHVEAISGDVQKATDAYAKPRTTWQKVSDWMKFIVYAGAHAL
jgi:hypothetical protein